MGRLRNKRGRTRGRGTTTSSFDPASLALEGWWRGSFTASPWTGTASGGGSGSRNLSEATNPPASGTAVNGFNPADFDGTNDQIGDATNFLSTYYTAGAYSGYALVYIDAISTDNAAVYDNDCIFSTQPSAYWILYLRSTGPTVGIRHVGAAEQIATATIATGAWQLVQWRYDGTNLEIRVNGGSWTTQTISDNLDAGGLAGSNERVGANYGAAQFFDGQIMELALSKVAIAKATFDDIRTYCNTRYGVSV